MHTYIIRHGQWDNGCQWLLVEHSLRQLLLLKNKSCLLPSFHGCIYIYQSSGRRKTTFSHKQNEYFPYFTCVGTTMLDRKHTLFYFTYCRNAIQSIAMDSIQSEDSNNLECTSQICSQCSSVDTMKQWFRMEVLEDHGWVLVSQFLPFRCFPNFSVLPKHTLDIEYHVDIWQVLLEDQKFSLLKK